MSEIDVTQIEPQTRKELMLANLCECGDEVPEPRTREEMYLAHLCENSSGSNLGLKVVDGCLNIEYKEE